MSNLYYISRNFVEFGAFQPEELIAFKERGVLLGSDYVRAEGADHWRPVDHWLLELASLPVPKAKAKAKRTTSKKAA